MDARPPLIAVFSVIAIAIGASGCGTTEKSGQVGDELSDHGGAVGPYDFGLDTSSGDDAKLKYPEQNYDDSFETVRDGCGDGWVVFEIPESSQADKVTFGFEDTGTSQHPETQVDAKFSWTVSD